MRITFRAALTAAAIRTAATAALADPVSATETLIGSLQKRLDLADVQAAGIVRNLAPETGNSRYLRQLKLFIPLQNPSD